MGIGEIVLMDVKHSFLREQIACDLSVSFNEQL